MRIKAIRDAWYKHSKHCFECNATIERLQDVEWMTVGIKRGKLLLCDRGRAILGEIFK